MRSAGVVGGLAVVGICIGVACSSSDGTSPPAMPEAEAGSDAPSAPPTEGGVDAGSDAGGVQHAGTRIKLHGIETAEGSFVYDAPFDSTLGSVCYPSRTEDGVLRCIPSVEATVSTFADAMCMTPLANTTKSACTTKPTLGIRYISSTTDHCDTRFAVYKLGAVAAVAKIYTQDVGVGCVQHDAAPDADYYTVLSAVPSTGLVTFTESIAPLSGDLGAYVLDGDDGSRIQRDYFSDVKRGKACDANVAGDDQIRCMPRSKATAGAFSDMACSVNGAIPAECVVSFEAFDDSTASIFGQSHCTQNKVRAFPLGAKRATRDVFQPDNDGGCAGPVAAPRDVYDVGPEIAPTTLPAMTPSTIGGPRIVQATLLSGGVVAKSVSYGLTDTTLGTKCTFLTAADGKLRCLPDGADAFLFTDDKCTVQVGIQADDCGPVKYVLRSEPGTCQVRHVYTAGAKLDALTPVFQLIGVNCLPTSTNAVAYYTLGAEVLPATFEEGTVVTK